MKLNYKHLVQKPSLCGPTCVQMILLRRGIWVDQEEIAKEIGVKIPEEESGVFYIPLPIGKTQKEFGISLVDFNSKKMSDFLNKRNIPLRVTVYFMNEITDAGQFIADNLEKGNDVMANFWMKPFKEDLDMGHFSIISGIEENTVTICDPWPTNKSFWETHIKELMKTMRNTFDGQERGFVVFNSILYAQ